MEYVTKHCPVCGKVFVMIWEAAHKVECCTLGCLDRMDLSFSPLTFRGICLGLGENDSGIFVCDVWLN